MGREGGGVGVLGAAGGVRVTLIPSLRPCSSEPDL